MLFHLLLVLVKQLHHIGIRVAVTPLTVCFHPLAASLSAYCSMTVSLLTVGSESAVGLMEVL